MLEIECEKYQEILEYCEHGATQAKEGENSLVSYQSFFTLIIILLSRSLGEQGPQFPFQRLVSTNNFGLSTNFHWTAQPTTTTITNPLPG